MLSLVNTRGWPVSWLSGVVLSVLFVLGTAPPAAAGWNTPVSITSPGDIGAVALAMNARGDAIAVWDRLTVRPNETGMSYAVEAAFRPVGGIWRKPVRLGTARVQCGRDCAGFPSLSVALGSRGEAVVGWPDANRSRFGTLWTAWRTAAGRWQRATVLVGLGKQPSYSEEHWPQTHAPKLVVDQHGNTTAVWNQLGKIQAAFKPAGRAWRKPTSIDGSGNGYGAQLALDAKGNATAVWGHNVSILRGQLVQSAFRPAGGSWRGPVTIGHVVGVAAPELAIDPRGNEVAAWGGYTTPNACCTNVVQAVFRPAGGHWSQPVTLERNHGTSAVHVAFGRLGNATAVWSVNEGIPSIRHAVRSAYRLAGGSWGRPVTIATAPTYIDSLRLGLDPRGDALAAWWVIPAPESPSLVQAAMASPQGTWQPPISLGGGTSGYADQATGAAFDSHGNAVVIWLHDDVSTSQQVVNAVTFTRDG